MNIKNFALEFYKNAADGFHIQRLSKPTEAKKLHTHEFYQIYYIESGSLTHYIENSSSNLFAGDMFIIPPGIKHRISEDPSCVFYSFSFMVSSLGEKNLANGFVLDFLQKISSDESVRPKITVPNEDVLQTENMIHYIYKEFYDKKAACGEIIRGYAIALLSLFARTYYESSLIFSSSYEDNQKFILTCIDYIKNNYFQDITMEEIVKLSAMSKTSFCSLFKQISGCSFNKYLNQCRIHQAIQYIETGYKITAIYGLCGYNDFSTFYRNFKKIMGISPKEYSARYRITADK